MKVVWRGPALSEVEGVRATQTRINCYNLLDFSSP